jgi:hypothetical protein
LAVAVVAGALANKPGNGGEAWVRMSWLEGLLQLGVDAFLFEEIDPGGCVDRAGNPAPLEESWNRSWFEQVTASFGLGDRSLLVESADGRVCHGPDAAKEIAESSSILINISGNLSRPDIFSRFRRRAYVDLDPGYTQAWHDQGADLGLSRHNLHFTVGRGIGSPNCSITSGGFDWVPVSPPVVLSRWPATRCEGLDRFTSVASWRGGYGPLQYDGVAYGVKAHEFRKFADLPRRCPVAFELALSIHPADSADRLMLVNNGWDLVEPTDVAGEPFAFREYVRRSAAEFSVAQNVYVAARTGWFSDRSAVYLASGRPVLVQDTGYAPAWPAGEGVVTFRNMDEAVAGVGRLTRDYQEHQEAARQIAEDHFDAKIVLEGVLQRCGVT